jgi:LPS-assembly lipoprotein
MGVKINSLKVNGLKIGASVPLKKLAALIGVGFFTVTLAGCGFTPLYGKNGTASAPEVVDAMSTVSIRPLPDRQGMKLRQVLRETMQPTGLTRAVYDLDVNFAQRIDELGIRPDATSSRANLVMSATFSLYEGGQRVYGDRVQSVVSYNILDDQFATVASQADAENRGIRQVGEEIRTRLAVYFHARMKTSAATPISN